MRDKTQILLEQAYQKVLLREYDNDGDSYEDYPPELKTELTRLLSDGGERKFEEVDAKGNPDYQGSRYVRALKDIELDGVKYVTGKVYKVGQPGYGTADVSEHDAVSAHIQHQDQTAYRPALDAQGKPTGAKISTYKTQDPRFGSSVAREGFEFRDNTFHAEPFDQGYDTGPQDGPNYPSFEDKLKKYIGKRVEMTINDSSDDFDDSNIVNVLGVLKRIKEHEDGDILVISPAKVDGAAVRTFFVPAENIRSITPGRP